MFGNQNAVIPLPHHPTPRLSIASIALAAIVTQHLPAQQVTLQQFINLTGTVESVSPGAIVITDDSGARQDLQIADKGEDAVPLKKAGVLVKFPAEVRVFGTFGPDALARGSLVQFTGRINRGGQSQGDVADVALLADSSASPTIEAENLPTSAREQVEVTITGVVYRMARDRLTVTVGNNPVTARDRLAFTLAEDAKVRLESTDYRRAEPGDRVVSARIAVLDSGDRVIQKLSIEKVLDKESTTADAADAEAALIAKYRHLSSEPGPIRDERSRHFVLHTDISPQSAAILLEKLETMIGLVSGYYGRPPRQIIECYVVRDLAQWPPGVFDESAANSIRTRGGVTQSRSLGRQAKAIVYAPDDHGTVQHEAVHAYCSQTFGDTGPVWYSEGMAEMGNYWQPDEPAVRIPAAAVHYLRTSPSKTMAEIVAAGQITGDSWQAYQWRWALCYLLANNPNYSQHFKGLGIGLMTGAPGVSFESVYGPVAPHIAFEYEQFLAHLDNGYRVDLTAWQWDHKWTPLQSGRRTAAKIDAVRGWQPTGVTVEEGQEYDFVAEGQWQSHPDADLTTANGAPDGSSENTGRLVAVVMRDYQLSESFDLGERGTFTAATSGNLYVRCRDDWNQLADNEGQITLHLRRAQSD